MTEVIAAGAEAPPRQRILESAYELFSHRAIGAVGIEEVIARARLRRPPSTGTSRRSTSSCSRFSSAASSVWTYGWVEKEARLRGDTPEASLLAIFDLFDEWFHRDDFEGCSFVNVLLETADRETEIGAASAMHLENIRVVVRSLAEEAGLRDVEQFALSFHILMKGAIVQAGEGDLDAAKRSQRMARLLIDQHR